MSVPGQVGYGTKLEYRVGSGSWTEMANIFDLVMPERRVRHHRFHVLRSVRWQRAKPAVGEVGNLGFILIWTAALDLALDALLFDETITWRITRADGTSTQAFAGSIEKIGTPVKVDEEDTLDVEIAVDNNVTVA